MRTLSPVALALLAFGCGDDAPSNQATESVDLVFTAANLNGDSITGEAAVLALDFMTDVRDALGHDLEGIELTKLVLVARSNTGLSGWSDLFDGDIQVFLETDHGTQFLASREAAPSGFGALSMPIQVTSEELSASEDMRMGRFSVYLVAPSGRNPEDLFSLSVRVDMTFVGR